MSATVQTAGVFVVIVTTCPEFGLAAVAVPVNVPGGAYVTAAVGAVKDVIVCAALLIVIVAPACAGT